MEEKTHNGELTYEKLKEAVEYIFSQPPKKQERKFVLYRYCKTLKGTVREESGTLGIICDDPECFHCSNKKKIFKEEFKKINESNQRDN